MYLPISRKYRPQNFEDIVGQEHITTTLVNAIKMDKVAHAYVFSGTRGVGKTTTARVFSKALNCEKGPTDKPCNKCTSCLEITSGSSLDVLEIDGASNRGIDEIRNLRENVKLKPMSGKYKIYIIDEVHMLTPEAFNALLKTLEEPPPHVKFIFATTRPYKIPPTILSRCQRFDFHMMANEKIVECLSSIARLEKINVDDEALPLIAKKSEGSMRDAQVMLDQIASYSKGKITSEDAAGMLGIIQEEHILNISRAVLESDSALLLHSLNELVNSGRDAAFVATSLIEHYRDMLVFKSSGKTASLPGIKKSNEKDFSDICGKYSLEEMFYIIYTLSNALDFMNRTSLGRIPLEVALIKISRREKLMPIKDVLNMLNTLPVDDTSARGPSINIRQEIRPVENDVNGIKEENASPEKATVPSDNGDFTLQRLKGIWPEVIRQVKIRKVSAGIYLEEGVLMGLDGDKIIIGFSKSNSLHKEALETKPNIEVVTQIISEIMEKSLKITCTFSDYLENDEITKKPDLATIPDDTQAASKKVEPIIRAAIDKFKGRIVKQYYVKEE